MKVQRNTLLKALLAVLVFAAVALAVLIGGLGMVAAVVMII